MPTILENTIVDGKSYTNKDFNSIYAELLDLVKVLTNKWDPSVSNESDPGVILLKLGAILADKNNYNIDKNVLECFPLSVTQYGNARKLYDMLGYSMHWYRSATTEVSFLYNGPYLKTDLQNTISIPRFTTMVTDDSGEIVYTLVENVILSAANNIISGKCIQGVIKDYDLNGVSTITIDNLDSDLRVYFEDRSVAENGIFIFNAGDTETAEEWTAVHNLESYSLNQKIYKFGVLPNSDTCYVQFPQDIANLIGSGLSIKYIVSSGESGNISANVLNSLYADLTVSLNTGDNNRQDITVNDNIVINNVYAALDGTDPESLGSAYNNYKKTIGTFNTLVTCLDYENAIYNLESEQESIVSNCVVSDRTNDINNSTYVVQLNADGNSKVLLDNDKMNAFNIGVYALAPMKNIYNDTFYNKSFSVNEDMSVIKADLEDYKIVQHDYIDTTPTVAIPYIFKNFYKLIGTLYTYYKVSRTEANDIENNVKIALYKNFNAHKVNFGEEISYDNILSVIQNADARIKYVALNRPEYTLTTMLSNDQVGTRDSVSLTPLNGNNNSGKEMIINLLARMVLNGTVQLFKFDQRFDYEFGQTNYPGIENNIVENISSITTEAAININSITDSNGYKIKKNENVQVYTTNLIPETTYSTYVNYRLENSTGKTSFIPKNTNYVLGESDVLRINYTDANNTVFDKSYEAGTIVKSTIDIELTGNKGSIIKNNVAYNTLKPGEDINIMAPNYTQLEERTYCIWYTNQVSANNKSEYILFNEGETEKILQNNEYFMYSNTDRNELVILTSGTKIQRAVAEGMPLPEVKMVNQVPVSYVLSNGQSAITDDSAWYLTNSSDGNFQVVELLIVSLGQDVSVKCEGVYNEGAGSNFGNQPILVYKPQYKGPNDDNYTSLILVENLAPVNGKYMYKGVDLSWYMMSRLNLNISSTTPQQLYGGQSVTLNNNSTFTITGSDTESIQVLSNINVTMTGGENVDTTVLTPENELETPLAVYVYEMANTTYERTNGYIRLKGTNATSLSFDFREGITYLIPVMVDVDIGTISVSNAVIYDGSKTGTSVAEFPAGTKGIYYLKVEPVGTSFSSITVTWTQDAVNATIGIGNINVIDGLSSQSSSTVEAIGENINNLLEAIDKIRADVSFDWTYKVPTTDSVNTSVLDTDSSDNVFAPRAVWDPNHICNKFTIAQYDTINSSIKVAASNKL